MLIIAPSWKVAMLNVCFPWNPSLGKADLYTHWLTRFSMIWPSIISLISSHLISFFFLSCSFLLQPQWPPWYSLNISGKLSVQGLCICSSLCLECSSPESHMAHSSLPSGFYWNVNLLKCSLRTLFKWSCFQLPMPFFSFNLLPSVCYHQKSPIIESP